MRGEIAIGCVEGDEVFVLDRRKFCANFGIHRGDAGLGRGGIGGVGFGVLGVEGGEGGCDLICPGGGVGRVHPSVRIGAAMVMCRLIGMVGVVCVRVGFAVASG